MVGPGSLLDYRLGYRVALRKTLFVRRVCVTDSSAGEKLTENFLRGTNCRGKS